MKYTVLSPWAASDRSEAIGIQPRPETLKGKTIGMFSHFKEHSPIMLRELEKLLSEKLPDTRFVHLQYARDTSEVVNDPEFNPVLKKWLNGVDAVISAYGDAGSCAMFHAYNTAYIEKLGKPCVMLVKSDLIRPASRGAAARLVPNLRLVACDMLDLSMLPTLDERILDEKMRPFLSTVADELINALTSPRSQRESVPKQLDEDWSSKTFTGTLEEINNLYYQEGWTNGAPVSPPTREAVDEMLRGTELPPEHEIGRIPPMLGIATVEKIAINAVMAGCQPTYMPILIAAVRGMLDPRIHLEGWTCSVSSWFPLIHVGGPIRKAIGINGKGAFLSPYFKPSATISRAIAFMVMNIGGVRPMLEDMSEMGHESRFGVVIGENEEDSPWAPMHTDYGFDAEDSVITMFWPNERLSLNSSTSQGLLEKLCNMDVLGWDPGAAIILSPNAARVFDEAGMSRQDVLDYIVEYNRQPGEKVMTRWLIGNNHLPGVQLPVSPSHMARRFWSKDHLFMLVGGSSYGHSMIAYTGGGDHGGPSMTKIELPKYWDELVKKYEIIRPGYIDY